MSFGYKIILFLLAIGVVCFDLSAAQDHEDKQLTYHREELQPGILSSSPEEMETYSFEFQDLPLGDALHKIADRGRLKILTNSSLIPKDYVVNGELNGITLSEAFSRVLEETGLDFYSPGNGYVIILPKQENPLQRSEQQQQSITGRVTDANTGEALPGVTVILENSNIGTATNLEGEYELFTDVEEGVLIFSAVGYVSSEVPIESRNLIDVELSRDTYGMEELVVTGYMEQRRADLTGAVTVVPSDVIAQNSYSNVLQGLQGRVPGVYIQTDGNPAAGANVQIRGITSVNASPPLIVMDGFPVDIHLRDINPNDIESIQVLKDASSASIYGSRAAGGVILIETKRGRGETQINYRGSLGASAFLNRENMLNTQQYGEALWRAAINDGLDPNEITQIYSYDWHRDANGRPVLQSVTPRECLNPDCTMRSADTDWFDELAQTGLQNDQQITLTTGTDSFRSLFSVNYHESQGTQIHTGVTRASFRVNTEFDVGNRLTVGENLSMTFQRLQNQNHMRAAIIMPPIVPVYADDGMWGGTAMGLGMDDYNNPVRAASVGANNKGNIGRIIGNVYANLNLAENLMVRSQIGLNYLSEFHRHVDYTWQEAGGRQDINSGVNGRQFHNIQWAWSNTITYNIDYRSHQASIIGGIEMEQFMSEGLQGHRQDIELETFQYAFLNSATGTQTVNGWGDEFRFFSYFSKVNYSFRNRYLLSATIRYDGSSKFGPDNRFGIFPAFSAGWRISEEDFFKENVSQRVLPYLQLRASWGRNGNSNIPTNALTNLYDANYNATLYDISGRKTGQMPSGYRKLRTGNPEIMWEATEQTNLGIDFQLFSSRFVGTLDYFQKATDGMLFEPPYIGAIGEGGFRWVNAADMTNTGWEFQVTYSHDTRTDFAWSVGLNLATYKNRIDNLPDEVRYTYGGNGLDDDIQGRPLGSFYGFVTNGIFRTQEEVDQHAEQPGKGVGRIRYKDLDGDGVISWDHDRTWLGDPNPDLQYGFNIDMQYKNFDLSMFFQGLYGIEVYNSWKTYSDFWNVWTQSGFNHPVRILNAWTPENPDSDIPALSLSNQNDELRSSDYFIERGDYLKLRHLEIGYSVPLSFTERLGVRQARIYATGQNLLNITRLLGMQEFTGVEPENSSQGAEYSFPYLRPQSFMLGIDLTF